MRIPARRLKKSLLAVGAMTLLHGCATSYNHPQTITEMDALREQRVAASTRKFQGTTEKELQAAFVRAFELLDKSDTRFDVADHKLLVGRSYLVYMAISAAMGRDYWAIQFKPQPDGIIVQVSATTRENAGIVATLPAEQFISEIPITGALFSGATVDDMTLLLDRVEFLLGRRTEWPECQRDRTLRVEAASMLCGRIGMDDRRPDPS